MMRKFDIVSIGELLIDMTPASMAQNSSMVFEVNPGGSSMQCFGYGCKAGRPLRVYRQGRSRRLWQYAYCNIGEVGHRDSRNS